MRNISLFALVEIALKHIFIIIAVALVAAIGVFSFCEFVAAPSYSATGSIIVTNGAIIDYDELNTDDGINNTDVAASLNFAYTVNDILNTNGIFKELADELDNKYTYSQLKSFSNIERRSNTTLFIDVTFTAGTKEEAIELVNTYLKLAPDYINTFGTKSAIAAASPADSASKVYPKTFLATAAAALIGAGLTYAVAFLIYCANTVIKCEDDFKDRFDVPIIGSIPDFSTAKNDKYYKYNSYYKRGKVKNEK
ncbi:MAG: hypothetical protein IJD55_04305 [Clostridia bacterium]|nr:hypothetical protein [Clostridia bacterium]